MIEIPLTQSKVAIVDDCDSHLAKFKWHLDAYGYAARKPPRENGRQRTIKMHREIIGAPSGLDVDHINGDKLDNRRCNLRLCTRAENLRNQRLASNNTSGFKGVSWNHGKWEARIKVNGESIYLGRFPTAEQAARAYDQASREYHGKFARPNAASTAA